MSTTVKEFYETHTYPHYPLWFRPRWQEGYLSSSLFSARLAYQKTGIPSPLFFQDLDPHILVGGSGEMLPYVVRKLEPSRHRVTALDLSSNSLRRAKIRLSTSLKKVHLVCDDLRSYLPKHPNQFAHIDLFGVLHHMIEPESVLPLLWDSLQDGGHTRIMVYNSIARSWIHEWQDNFLALNLDYKKPKDLEHARILLFNAAQQSEGLRSMLKMMGPSLLNNPARFADTFMHVHEERISASNWLDWFEKHGFLIIGMFDRYGELDDLANPLLTMPKAHSLESKARSGEWLGNLEIYLQKPSEVQKRTKTRGLLGQESTLWKLKGYPLLWKSYEDTKDLGVLKAQKFWMNFVDCLDEPDVSMSQTKDCDRLCRLTACSSGNG